MMLTRSENRLSHQRTLHHLKCYAIGASKSSESLEDKLQHWSMEELRDAEHSLAWRSGRDEFKTRRKVALADHVARALRAYHEEVIEEIKRYLAK